jgi:hypothetical protein
MRPEARLIAVVAVAMLAIVAACGSAEITMPPVASPVSPAAGSPAPQTPPGGSTPEAATPASPSGVAWPRTPAPSPTCEARLDDPRAIAADLYSQLAAGQDPLALVTEVVECIGVPVLASTESDDTIKAFLTGTYPGVLDFELEGVAASLRSGALVGLDGFLSDLAAKGMVGKADGRPISRAAWDAGIGAAAGTAGPARIIPRLLQALDQERAARDSQAGAVAGERSLDALQLLLVNLGLEAASRAQRTGAHTGHGGVQLVSMKVAELGSVVDILVFIDSMAKVPYTANAFGICSAAIGGFTVVSLLETPPTIWHRSGGKPDTANVEATVSFTHEFSPRQTGVLEGLNCPPPPKGGIAGKTVKWFLDAAGHDHGQLTQQGSSTTAVGRVEAEYQTIGETTPVDDQTPENEKQAAAIVTVQVQDLLPGFPSTSTGWRAIYGTSAVNYVSPSGSSTIDVHYYEPADYRIDTITTAPGANVRVRSTKCGHAGGVWTVKLTGTVGDGNLDFTGTVRMSLDEASLKGPFVGSFAAKALGRPVGATGRIGGDAELVGALLDAPHLTLNVEGQGDIGYARGFFRAGPTGQTRTWDIPVTKGHFCP